MKTAIFLRLILMATSVFFSQASYGSTLKCFASLEAYQESKGSLATTPLAKIPITFTRGTNGKVWDPLNVGMKIYEQSGQLRFQTVSWVGSDISFSDDKIKSLCYDSGTKEISVSTDEGVNLKLKTTERKNDYWVAPVAGKKIGGLITLNPDETSYNEKVRYINKGAELWGKEKNPKLDASSSAEGTR